MLAFGIRSVLRLDLVVTTEPLLARLPRGQSGRKRWHDGSGRLGDQGRSRRGSRRNGEQLRSWRRLRHH
jgi:hypothetical protein